MWAGEDGLAIKSTCCSYRGSVFGSQILYGGSLMYCLGIFLKYYLFLQIFFVCVCVCVFPMTFKIVPTVGRVV